MDGADEAVAVPDVVVALVEADTPMRTPVHERRYWGSSDEDGREGTGVVKEREPLDGLALSLQLGHQGTAQHGRVDRERTHVSLGGDKPGTEVLESDRSTPVSTGARKPESSVDSPKPPYAHPTATIDDGAEIGLGTRVWHYCHISSETRIGERCSFGQNCFVAPGVEIGSNVKVQNNVSIYTGTQIEDDVFLGPSCVLTNVVNPRSHVPRRDEYTTTILRRGATVGANATIVCGTEIGRFAFIGAGTVVIRDVSPFAQVVGNPARQVGWRCQCGEKLATPVGPSGETRCDPCGAEYREESGSLAWLNEAN
jgi:UDP-2-acetamido-3-amino-2,3-dideoxy-glucuronate N-acetyltransferase